MSTLCVCVCVGGGGGGVPVEHFDECLTKPEVIPHVGPPHFHVNKQLRTNYYLHLPLTASTKDN